MLQQVLIKYEIVVCTRSYICMYVCMYVCMVICRQQGPVHCDPLEVLLKLSHIKLQMMKLVRMRTQRGTERMAAVSKLLTCLTR